MIVVLLAFSNITIRVPVFSFGCLTSLANLFFSYLFSILIPLVVDDSAAGPSSCAPLTRLCSSWAPQRECTDINIFGVLEYQPYPHRGLVA